MKIIYSILLTLSISSLGHAQSAGNSGYGMNRWGFSSTEFLVYGSIGLAIYFMPTIIAFRKNHINRIPIFVINWFAFTIVIWLVALVWALKKDNPLIVSSAPSNDLDNLEKLSELKDKGIITNEEFENKKAQILNL